MRSEGAGPAGTADSTDTSSDVGATSSVAPRRPRDQRGSVLLLVLGVVLMLTIAVLGLLRMSSSTGAVAAGLETSTRTLHLIDGAIEQSVNSVREDPEACPKLPPAPPENFGDYDVQCVLESADGEDPRRMSFLATKAGSAEVVGRASIRVVDQVNGTPNIGYSIEVCDWLLGRNVHEEPQECSA